MEPGGRKQLQIQKPGFRANMGISCHHCSERALCSRRQEKSLCTRDSFLFESSKFLRGFREKDGKVSLVDSQSKPTPFLSLENKLTENRGIPTAVHHESRSRLGNCCHQ